MPRAEGRPIGQFRQAMLCTGIRVDRRQHGANGVRARLLGPQRHAELRLTAGAAQEHDQLPGHLMRDGLVMRYSAVAHKDGLAPGEGTFLPCSFWLANALALIGRRDDAVALFERLLALGNDVGLFAEEYDARGKRMLGNFPQALTHMALVNSAYLLSKPREEAKQASEAGERPAAVARTA